MTHHRTTALGRAKKERAEKLVSGRHAMPDDFPVPPRRLAQFERSVHGRIVLPGDKDYDEARTEFNPAYPTFPKIIVFCDCLNDVRECLALARELDMWAVARSGRHSLAGYSVCDGMVIDVSAMNSVSIDRKGLTATVGAGTQFGDFNAHLESVGLHTPGGGCPTVAVAGYMMGGGYGFTSREFGMNSDNVLSIRMVLADGRLVHADAEQNADLYWAVRGGTGNQFGVLIDVTYCLYELGKVWGMRLDWCVEKDADAAALALKTIQDAYINSPDYNHLGFQTALGYDSQFNDGLRVMFCAIFNGDGAAFDEALKPLMAIGGHEVVTRLYDVYSRVDETLLARIPDIPGPQVKGMSQSRYFADDLEVEDWKAILEFVQTAPNQWTVIDMEAYGGRISEIAEDASAFMHRKVKLDFFCDVFWDKDEDRDCNVQWLLKLMAFVDKYSNGHSFQNYPCRLQEDWRWAYFGPNYPTLVWIKQKYDPDNFFRYQQSITPDPEPRNARDCAPVLFSDPEIVCEDY